MKAFKIFCLLCLAATLNAQTDRSHLVREQLDRIFDDVAFVRGFWGVQVKSLDTGRILYERNADKYLMPASNMKLLTAAAALRLLGPEHRFRTVIARNGTIKKGRLSGDLVIVGSGDPSLGARFNSPDLEDPSLGDPLFVFKEWAARLKKAGIERIEGDLVGDIGVFDELPLGFGWSWDDIGYGYSAQISGLQFNENVVFLTIESGQTVGAPARLRLNPQEDGLTLDNRIQTVALDQPHDIELLRRPGTNFVVLSGTIPLGGRPSQLQLAVHDPGRYFLEMLRATLERQGITIDGAMRLAASAKASPQRQVVFVHESPPLERILRVLLKVSQNLYAETLVKTLDPSERGKTSRGGIERVKGALTKMGIPPDSYIMLDGSGLSRYNFLTADMIVRLLESLARDPLRETWAGLLPTAGVDGTLADRLLGTRAEKRVQAKTGTLTNVRALSGYLITQKGERLAFSMIANNFDQPMRSAEYLQDSALIFLADLPVPQSRPDR